MARADSASPASASRDRSSSFPTRSAPWGVAAAAARAHGSLEAVSAAGRPGPVELLLVGTGARMTQIDRACARSCARTAWSIEPMDTGAACRTYNVLLAEGRRVAAALIAVRTRISGAISGAAAPPPQSPHRGSHRVAIRVAGMEVRLQSRVGPDDALHRRAGRVSTPSAGRRAGRRWTASRCFENEFWTARQRQAHPLHEISYRACFKPQLPRFFIERLTAPGERRLRPVHGPRHHAGRGRAARAAGRSATTSIR